MPWKKLLANVTGSIDEELRLRNEHLVIENRILRSKVKGRLRLKDEERRQLAEIGKKLGPKALETIATIVKPDTILRWHAKLVARKFGVPAKTGTTSSLPGNRRADTTICSREQELGL